MKTFRLLLILCFVFCLSNAEAQTKKLKKIAPKTAKAKTAKKIPKTVSASVVNGKAIDLVKPEYPKLAIAANIYGQVIIQVLIDENGDVISARTDSGHPLLSSVSLKAAQKSKFEPITIGGEPVRVNGIIVYKFIPHQWNWLEIGFSLNNSWSSYYSLESLSETLPLSFEEERQLLRQSVDSFENQDEITNTVSALLESKLTNDEKEAWLFSVGLVLAQITKECCRVDEEMHNSVERIKILLQSEPENISIHLTSNLKKLVLITENPHLDTYNQREGNQIYQLLKNLEQKFPSAGR